jgi:hypothetical protein
MTEAILLALWIGTALFFICREIKMNDDSKTHKWWLSELRDCIHSIECEFRWRCQEIAEEMIQQHNSSLCVARIRDLKKEYLNDVYQKVVEKKGNNFLTTLPDYVAKEYERNISEIADIYLDLIKLY